MDHAELAEAGGVFRMADGVGLRQPVGLHETAGVTQCNDALEFRLDLSLDVR